MTADNAGMETGVCEGDLERLWLLLLHGIVPAVCNPVVMGAVQHPSPPSLTCISRLWLLHLPAVYTLVHQFRIYWGRESTAAGLFCTWNLT